MRGAAGCPISDGNWLSIGGFTCLGSQWLAATDPMIDAQQVRKLSISRAVTQELLRCIAKRLKRKEGKKQKDIDKTEIRTLDPEGIRFLI